MPRNCHPINKRKRKGFKNNYGGSFHECSVKRSFDTKEDALEEMEFLKASKEYKKLKRAYECDLCNMWHLTKKPDFNRGSR